MSDEFPDEDYAKEIADEHWEYVKSICEKMYKGAFVHGVKHGVSLQRTKEQQKVGEGTNVPE